MSTIQVQFLVVDLSNFNEHRGTDLNFKEHSLTITRLNLSRDLSNFDKYRETDLNFEEQEFCEIAIADSKRKQRKFYKKKRALRLLSRTM